MALRPIEELFADYEVPKPTADQIATMEARHKKGEAFHYTVDDAGNLVDQPVTSPKMGGLRPMSELYGDREYVGAPKPKEEIKSPTFGDYAKEFGSSALDAFGYAAQAGGELLAKGLNAATDSQFFRAENPLQPASDKFRDSMTAGGKAARNDGFQGDILAPDTWELPKTASGLAMAFTNGLGSVATMILPAGMALKGAKGVATVGAVMGGATTGGAAANEIRQNLEALSQQDWDKVPAYQEARAKGMSDADAKMQITNYAAQTGGALSAIAGAAGGAFNARFLEDLVAKKGMASLLGKVSDKPLGRAVAGGAAGAVAEGFQEGMEKVGQNVGENIGLGLPAGASATRDTLGDVAGGFMVGKVTGMIGGAHASTTQDILNSGSTDEAIKKATEANTAASEVLAKAVGGEPVKIFRDYHDDGAKAAYRAGLDAYTPTGSFGQVDELANFAAEEKADLAERREPTAMQRAMQAAQEKRNANKLVSGQPAAAEGTAANEGVGTAVSQAAEAVQAANPSEPSGAAVSAGLAKTESRLNPANLVQESRVEPAKPYSMWSVNGAKEPVRPINEPVGQGTKAGESDAVLSGSVQKSPVSTEREQAPKVDSVPNLSTTVLNSGTQNVSPKVETPANSENKADRRATPRYNPEVDAAFKRARELQDSAKTPEEFAAADKALNDAADLVEGKANPKVNDSPVLPGDRTFKDGKLFKSAKSAELYKKQNNVPKSAAVTPIIENGKQVGFVLRPRERTRGQVLAAEQRKKARVTPDATRDNLWTYIGKLGGLNPDEIRSTWGIDRADKFRSSEATAPTIRAQGQGESIDSMLEKLRQAGFKDAEGKELEYPAQLEEMFKEGDQHHHPIGRDRLAQLSLEARAADEQRRAMALPDEALDEFDQLAKESQSRVQSTWDSFEDEIGAKIYGQNAVDELNAADEEYTNEFAKREAEAEAVAQDRERGAADAAKDEGKVQRPESAGKGSSPEGDAKEAGSGAVKGYIRESEYNKELGATYKNADSRTTPQTAAIPKLGTWMRSDDKTMDGHLVYELVELPADNIEISEDTGPQKWADVKRYAEWLVAGKEAPPIRVTQTDKGTLKATDHRRLLAAKAAGKPTIKAWVSWTTTSERGTETGLTQELRDAGAKHLPIKQARADYTIHKIDAPALARIKSELAQQPVAPAPTSQERVAETGKSEQVAPTQETTQDATQETAVYEVGKKHNGRIPEIKYLPVSAIHRQEMDFRPEVTSVSDEVAANMDYSTPVEVTAFRYGPRNDGAEPVVTLTDGHHRTAAAIQTGRPFLPVNVRAINALGEKLNSLIAMSRAIEATIPYKMSGKVSGKTSVQSDPLLATLNTLNETMGKVVDALTLQNQTPAELQAKKDAEEKAAKEKAEADKKAAEAEAKAQERETVRQRSEGAAADFQLGQSAMDNLSGQRGLFSRKAMDDETKSANFKTWSDNAPLVKANEGMDYDFKTGQNVVVEAFHGTGRPDRVGNIFKRSRATSGPMAFFTNTPTLASGYAEGKQDTSLANENNNYENWFKFKQKGERSSRTIDRAWYALTTEQREKIRALAPRVMFDEEGDQVVLGPEDHASGTGGYDQHLKETRTTFMREGNPLKALVEEWLSSGNLYDREEQFMDVLKLAGMPMQDVTYDSPNARYPFVFHGHVSMLNPLVTNDIPQNVIDALDAAAKSDRTSPAKYGADPWDKSQQTVKGWMERFNSDDRQYVWTSIPDKVTAVFERFGYDGIIDVGGKNGGKNHIVLIPFQSSQFKALGNKGTYDRDSQNMMFSRGGIWKSQMLDAIGTLMANQEPAKALSLKVEAWAKAGKFKQDELTWSGLSDWLKTQDGKVTKQQVQDFIRENGVQVEEVVLGGETPMFKVVDQNGAFHEAFEDRSEAEASAAEIGGDVRETTSDAKHLGRPTKFQNYQLPGGENYRELLLTLPEKKNAPVDSGKSAATMLFERDMMEKYGGSTFPSVYNKLSPSEIDKYEMYVREDRNAAKSESLAQDRRNNYKSSHWDQPNILAHVRFNERTDAEGKRVLFIEEIQGDWPQSYRKQKDAIVVQVDNDFQGIVERMKKAGVLEVNCD